MKNKLISSLNNKLTLNKFSVISNFINNLIIKLILNSLINKLILNNCDILNNLIDNNSK